MKIVAKIVGIAPLLHHKCNLEGDASKTGKKDEQHDGVEEAKKACYFDEEIGCYVPSRQVKASMREAAKNFKNKRGNHKATILSSVFINEEKLPLNTREYIVDVSPVNIQKNKVLRHRPRFDKWAVEFTATVDDQRMSAKLFKDILEEAGAVKGVGDYRPEYGRFKVEKCEIME
jgi:hypothetical protein